MTCHNRKCTSIRALDSLFCAISVYPYHKFKVYLTDDGCTDGTSECISELFPEVIILKGCGNLYWGGGMNFAWMQALQDYRYDYYLWFNDDANLYINALEILFAPLKLKTRIIVSGAFCSSIGKVSYGGRTKKYELITPNGNYQNVYFLNGNLVLIPREVVENIGLIDSTFRHGLGDFDYGLRALKEGVDVLLTSEFVGISDRHDTDLTPFWSKDVSLINRFRLLYSPKYSVIIKSKFVYRHIGIFMMIRSFLTANIYTLFPKIYENRKGR